VRTEVITGFLLDFGFGLKLWVTAGHCAGYLREIVDKMGNSARAAWIDDLDDNGVERPCSLQHLNFLGIESDEHGIDFAFIILSGLDLAHLAACSRTFFRRENIATRSLIKNKRVFEFKSYGFPNCYTAVSPSDGKNDRTVISTTCVGLPLHPLREEPGADSFLNRKGGFALEYAIEGLSDGRPFSHPRGMSGAPVVGEFVDQFGNHSHLLVGIQVACDDSNPKRVFCTDINTLRSAMKMQLKRFAQYMRELRRAGIVDS
jgi:hypothetical protein